jgi:hypothetical protein
MRHPLQFQGSPGGQALQKNLIDMRPAIAANHRLASQQVN